MNRFLSILLIFGLPTLSSSAQPTTGFSGTGDNIDVKYHRMEWTIDPTQSKYISGKVTTYFVTTKGNVNRITFDLNKSSFNNANLKVFYHGTQVTHSFPSSGAPNILTINLGTTLPIGRLDSVTIQYAGVPPAVSGQAEGYQQKPNAGFPLTYTLSESYEDRDWWPCKADMQDKIDSIDIIITTPSAYRPAANGVLVNERTSGTNKIYTFKHRYPIASYLVGIAVTQYNVYDRGTVNVSGTQVPIIYYVSKGRTVTASNLSRMDECKLEMVAFSNWFGDYPFKNEKYGMYEFAWGGGMEHQTFSAMGWSAMNSTGIIAHELMHQWFGNKVTFKTWNELWLAEGFARYSEALALEIPGIGGDPASRRASFKSSANGSLRTVGCYVPNSNITSSNALWGSAYGSSVYERGAMVVSMLRTLMGDDRFFQACRNYLNDPQLAYQSATTSDLKAHMEAMLDGFDLTGFFDSYVYGNGYPTFSGASSIKWQSIDGGKIRFRVDPPGKSSGSTVASYYSVIPLLVKGAGGAQKLVVLYHDPVKGVSIGGNGITRGNSPTPEVDLGFIPTSVEFDPLNMSLATGTTAKTTVLPITITTFNVSPQINGNLATLGLVAGQNPISVVLEKSNDGLQFTLAGAMKKDGEQTYTYHDESNVGDVFYRARITETTGEITYSMVVKLAGKRTAGFNLIGNPVRNNIRIKVPTDLSLNTLNFSAYDAAGRKVLEEVRKPMGGIVQLEAGNLQNGTYLLHIYSEQKHETLQFMVNK